jgi:acetoin utilization deacetylase AcuC-like enzyme
MSETAYFYSPRFLEHDPPPESLHLGGVQIKLGHEHTSNARLTQAAHELIEYSGLLRALRPVTPEPIAERLLHRVHDPEYVRRLDEASAGGPWDAHAAPVVAGTADAARLAAGAATQAAQLVTSGQSRRAFVNARPAGHHAERNRAMGSTYLNNVACAAESARLAGADRVMIVDWDVHIGNGAHEIFWSRDDVLAMSIHQDRWYPDHAGGVDQIGADGAEGATVNVPLPPGTTNAGYALVFEHLVYPIARAFRPDILVIAAGQDPSVFDPMGRMIVSVEGFRMLGALARELAEEVCLGRVVCSVEGGYSHIYSPLCTAAVLEGLSGQTGHVPDPFAEDPEVVVARDPPSPAVRAAIKAVTAYQPRWFG